MVSINTIQCILFSIKSYSKRDNQYKTFKDSLVCKTTSNNDSKIVHLCSVKFISVGKIIIKLLKNIL